MSVFKRYKGKKVTSKDKNWDIARWVIYKRLGGQIIHKSVPEAITKKDAELAERREIEKLFNRRYGIQDTTITFAKFVDKNYSKYVLQNNVNIKAKNLYIANLKAFFGKMPLASITPQDCRDFRYKTELTKTKRGAERSPSSVNREMSTLSKIFTLACEEELLERNPAQFVKKLKEPPARKMLLTDDQKTRFWMEVEKDKFLWRIVILAVNLPLRRGQILAIRKEDVEFEKNIVNVIGSKGRDARPVPLNAKAKSVLKELCEETSSGILFRYTEKSNVMKHYKGSQVKNFGKRWRSCLVRAGINEKDGTREDNFHFHDLRKMFTMNLIEKGVPLSTIQDLFAHSSADITKIYAPANDAHLAAAVGLLDDGKVQEVSGIN